MCELFGFSGKKKTDLTDYWKAFFSHSVKHPHGWGMLYNGGIVKEPVKAVESELLPLILNKIEPQKNILARCIRTSVDYDTQRNDLLR